MSGKQWFPVLVLSVVTFVTVGSFLLPTIQSAEGQTVAAVDPITGVPFPEFLVRTEKEVRGRQSTLEIDFSSVLVDAYVEVEIRLNKTEKSFIAEYVAKPEWELVMLDVVPWQRGDPHQTRSKTKEDEALLLAFYGVLAQELDPSLRDPSVTERYPPIEVEAKLLGFVRLLLGFIPVDMYWDGTDKFRREGHPARPRSSLQSGGGALAINRICDLRGQVHTATFTLGGQTYTPTAVVGDPATQCIGRCGIGCIHSSDLGHPRNYTQDCFNHDLCTDANGGNYFGECNDEFVVASDDFNSLIGCPHFLVGSWDVATDQGCDGTSSPHRALIGGGGTFAVCGGTEGTWTSLGDEVTFNYATGAVYTGTVDQADLGMGGNFTRPGGETGCWDAIHVTTAHTCN